MMRRFGGAGRVVRDGMSAFSRNHGMVYSASVAFNLLLSSVPVLFLVFAATSLFIGSRDLPFVQLRDALRTTFPYGAQVLVPILRGIFSSGGAFGILGSLLLVLSSFSATDAVHTSLAVMMEVPERKRFWSKAAFHAALILSLTVLSALAIFVPPLWKALSVLGKRIPFGLGEAFHLLLVAVAEVVLAGILFSGAALCYRYLAPVRVRWKNALTGSVLFLALIQGIKWGFTFYVRKFSRLNVIYGSLFGIICFIIVAYLFAAAFLFGASMIGVLERRREDGPPGEGTGAGGGESPGGD